MFVSPPASEPRTPPVHGTSESKPWNHAMSVVSLNNEEHKLRSHSHNETTFELWRIGLLLESASLEYPFNKQQKFEPLGSSFP